MSLYIIVVGLLLSYVEHTAARAVSEGLQSQDHGDNTTAAALEKRIGMAVVPTHVRTIYLTGDPRRARTADLGFDFQINYPSGLWAPCPTTVLEPNDCMVGSCYDDFLCSEGCGNTAGTLAAITCTRSTDTFCSTALLTYQSNIPAASNYACADDVGQGNYMAFTAELPLPLDSTTSTSTTPPLSTDSGASIARDGTQSGLPRSTEPPSGSSTSGPGAKSDSADGAGSNASPANNTGLIIGGVAGCLALVCGCALAIVWLMRRKKNAKAKASSVSSNTSEGDGASFGAKPELDASGRVVSGRVMSGRVGNERVELFGQSLSEMSARGPAAYDTSTYRADGHPMTPVELPTNARAGWM
jgi:hypothetical protein